MLEQASVSRKRALWRTPPVREDRQIGCRFKAAQKMRQLNFSANLTLCKDARCIFRKNYPFVGVRLKRRVWKTIQKQ
jgi:hypothetical protein